MNLVEICWIDEECDFKTALIKLLHCSKQLIKKHYDSKSLNTKIYPKKILKIDINLINHLKINPSFQGPELKILFEDNSYLVIHKSFNLHSHPQRYEDQNTALNFLSYSKRWDLLQVNEIHYDRGLLYRLDFVTSGLLVLAKNEELYLRMRKNFSSIVKEKFYLAVVKGDFSEEGKWVNYFRPSQKKGSKQVVTQVSDISSDQGVLEVKKVVFHLGYSLLVIKLETGLRHQIRAQLAFMGYPIVGDELYGGEKSERVFLHAWRYKIEDQIFEDRDAELFNRFFDLNSTFQVTQDMINRF